MKNHVIEAIDLGFGYSKYTVNGKPNIMPSLAVLNSNRHVEGEYLESADVVAVRVDDVEYLVGPEIEKIATTETKVLNRDYVSSAQYKALCYGCLSKMGHTEIDYLAVGLPNNNYERMKGTLQKLLQGKHKISKKLTVHVKKVLVIRQPIAGLIQYAQDQSKFDEMKESRTLRLDFGYFSTDWIVADGFTPVENLCDASDTGAYSIYNQVMRHLNETVIPDMELDKLESSDYARLDKGLRTGNLRLCGQKIPLDGVVDGHKKHKPVENIIFQVSRQAIMDCRNNIGESAKTIDKITMGGGSAPMYLKAVKEAFPNHDVHEETEGQYSNLLGLRFAALSHAEHVDS